MEIVDCFVKLERLDKKLVKKYLQITNVTNLINTSKKQKKNTCKKNSTRQRKSANKSDRRNYGKRKAEEKDDKKRTKKPSSSTKFSEPKSTKTNERKNPMNHQEKEHFGGFYQNPIIVKSLKQEMIRPEVNFEETNHTEVEDPICSTEDLSSGTLRVKQEESLEIWDVSDECQDNIPQTAEDYDSREEDGEDDAHTVLFSDPCKENPTESFVEASTFQGDSNNNSSSLLEEVLDEVCGFVKHLHDVRRVIQRLDNDMPKDSQVADHYAKVIMLEKIKFRAEIVGKLEVILKCYIMLMNVLKNPQDVVRKISERTFLDSKDVAQIISMCMTVEKIIHRHRNQKENLRQNLQKLRPQVAASVDSNGRPLSSVTLSADLGTENDCKFLEEVTIPGQERTTCPHAYPSEVPNGWRANSRNEVGQVSKVVPLPYTYYPTAKPLSNPCNGPKISRDSKLGDTASRQTVNCQNHHNFPVSPIQATPFPLRDSTVQPMTEFYNRNQLRTDGNFYQATSKQYYSAENRTSPNYAFDQSLPTYTHSESVPFSNVPTLVNPQFNSSNASNLLVNLKQKTQATNHTVDGYNAVETDVMPRANLNNATSLYPQVKRNCTSLPANRCFPAPRHGPISTSNQYSCTNNSNIFSISNHEPLFHTSNGIPVNMSNQSPFSCQENEYFSSATTNIINNIPTIQNESTSTNALRLVRKRPSMRPSNENNFDSSINGNFHPQTDCNLLLTSEGSSEIQDTFNPTIPQKLTMVNQRLQAGAVLEPSEASSLKPKISSNGKIQADTRLRIRRCVANNWLEKDLGNRIYFCAEDNCSNPATGVCAGCRATTYCSSQCMASHWRSKHRRQCKKLNTLNEMTTNSTEKIS